MIFCLFFRYFYKLEKKKKKKKKDKIGGFRIQDLSRKDTVDSGINVALRLQSPKFINFVTFCKEPHSY